MASSLLYAAGLLSLASLASAQFPPPPEGVITLQSKFHEGIKISYKEPGICETTPGVRSYSGYVHLPPGSVNESHEAQDYPINTFFWFFESRKDPENAPLAIWLNGGPGGSSLAGALSENGPCFIGNDSNSTYLNPWSWNNEVNLLFLDQPNQVGYSYDVATNVTLTLEPHQFEQLIEAADFSDGVPETNTTFMVGTLSSQNASHTVNSTRHAAVALWHFAQTFFEEFPFYKPADEQISLFTESYGGHYGPAFVSYFLKQNELISNGTISGPGVHYLLMNTLGIVNGCVDGEEQWKAYASFPWNNTYGIKTWTEAEYHHAMYEVHRPGGAIEMTRECERLREKLDPNDYADVERVNSVCYKAAEIGGNATVMPYINSSRTGWFDITHQGTDPFPPFYLAGFLNQHWVQKALGVPVNHTFVSIPVAETFESSGDFAKGGLVQDLGYILDHGVKVAMMYGDRDYACSWPQGEGSSLKIPWKYQDDFASAGYTPLVLDQLHSGGLTRQFGNLSFTRVYQAGHMVPSYQPEASYKIFMRSLLGHDIATGEVDLQAVAAEGQQYSTEGSKDSWWMKNDVLPSPPNECYIWDMGRCTEEEIDSIFDGTAIVKDWIVVGKEGGTQSLAGNDVLSPGASDQQPLAEASKLFREQQHHIMPPNAQSHKHNITSSERDYHAIRAANGSRKYRTYADAVRAGNTNKHEPDDDFNTNIKNYKEWPEAPNGAPLIPRAKPDGKGWFSWLRW